ncbi:hypothetical protein [Pinisolibacter sp.]|uniref:hypothetical protein n=1 Tax=Pinisolibacter sp. TaxID=2172024 RepID=UPI002FDD84E2
MQVNARTKIDARIAGAFRIASEATGASFDQLARTAARESDVRTDLGSATSSAKGLYQFVDQTWYELIKKEGPSVGLDRLAGAITSDGKGGWTVADATDKAKILSLKTDPLVSSIMAGRLTAANTRLLTDSLGRTPTEGEVYAAHVLGAAGATKLVRMTESEPNTSASLAFPKAAAANPDLFYGKTGKPRSAAELLTTLTATSSDTSTRVAEAHAVAATVRSPKLDPQTLAGLVRAQAASTVAGEGMGGDGLDRLVGGRFAKVALTEKSLPGSSRDIVPAAAARVDGWRAKAASDAFSALMRSDGAVSTADAAAPSTATADPAATTMPIRFAAGGGRHAVGGVAGGIPFVDPNQPLRLGADPTPPLFAAATAPTDGVRPSRLITAATTGAPAMPLPMVDGGTVVRPSRIFIGAAAASPDAAAPSGLVATGAARVETVSIAPAPAASSAAGSARPLLPPVPGETVDAAAPSVPTTAARSSSRSHRPLDLLGLQRRALTGG